MATRITDKVLTFSIHKEGPEVERNKASNHYKVWPKLLTVTSQKKTSKWLINILKFPKT